MSNDSTFCIFLKIYSFLLSLVQDIIFVTQSILDPTTNHLATWVDAFLVSAHAVHVWIHDVECRPIVTAHCNFSPISLQ
jgi:hypothetical protein